MNNNNDSGANWRERLKFMDMPTEQYQEIKLIIEQERIQAQIEILEEILKESYINEYGWDEEVVWTGDIKERLKELKNGN